MLVGEKENKQNPIKYVGTQKCEGSYGSLWEERGVSHGHGGLSGEDNVSPEL